MESFEAIAKEMVTHRLLWRARSRQKTCGLNISIQCVATLHRAILQNYVNILPSCIASCSRKCQSEAQACVMQHLFWNWDLWVDSTHPNGRQWRTIQPGPGNYKSAACQQKLNVCMCVFVCMWHVNLLHWLLIFSSSIYLVNSNTALPDFPSHFKVGHIFHVQIKPADLCTHMRWWLMGRTWMRAKIMVAAFGIPGVHRLWS